MKYISYKKIKLYTKNEVFLVIVLIFKISQIILILLKTQLMLRNTTLFLSVLVFIFSLKSYGQQHNEDLGALIPEATATHIAKSSGDWFNPAIWTGNEVPTEGAIVYIPSSFTITYEGQSTAHIFAIRVDGTFIATQNTATETTTLVVDTFIGTHMSTVKFNADAPTDGKIDVTLKPFDIEVHKASITPPTQWSNTARNHFSDGATTFKVEREYVGEKRYNSYDEAIADASTKMVEISRENDNDGPGVLGRHNWDAQQLSLGLVVMGQLEILGQEKTNMVKLGADALRGQRNVVLSENPIGWEADDWLIITRGGNINAVSNGEDEVQISTINGSTITTTTNLKKNHEGRPQDNLHCYVGNLTRNITFKSAVSDNIHQRGHLMAMHNDTNIQIKNAAMVDMGRTDKSRMTDDRYWEKWIEPKVFKSKMSPLGQECAQMQEASKDEITNHRGRYSIHLHKTGAKFGANMVEVTGNAIWGNPGWGITHHDSHANVSENVVYDVIGAGIVSETGSETGFWNNNLVVKIEIGSKQDPYIAALFYDDYLYSGQGLAMKGRAVVCKGNVIANAKNGVGIINMNPAINSVDRVDAKQLATVRPGFEIDQFPLSVNGYSAEGDGIMPVEVALIMENTTVIGCTQALRSVERDMGVNHESRSVFDGFYAWGVNQGLSITYQADYTFHDVFISGRNEFALGAFLWKHSHNHVFDGIKMVDLAHGITVSKLVESGNGELKTRNNGFSPWYFIDLELENVGEFYEIIKEDETTTTSYTEHPDNPIHLKGNRDVFQRPTTFTLTDNADLAVDYQNLDFKFSVDGIVSDDLGTYKMGIEQALAQKTLRNDYPERLYEFASKVKFDEYVTKNGVYEHPLEGYKYFILNEALPNRLSSKYTTFPVRIKIENAPETGIFASPQMEPLTNFTSELKLVSISADVSQSSTATNVAYDGNAIDCGPGKAIDGNNNGRVNAQIFQRGLVPLGSFSQTQQEMNPWYELDLKEIRDIYTIDIWNRVSLSGTAIETPAAELTDFYVMISEEPFTDMTLQEAQDSAKKTFHITDSDLRRFALNDVNTKGRYIRIQMNGTKALSLAEVEVIGSENLCQRDDTPPTVLTKDIEVHLDETGIVEITADDINDESTDGCGIASMEVDKTSFTCNETGENTVSLTVTDVQGNTSSKLAMVTVLSAMPIITCPEEPLEIEVNADDSLQLPNFESWVVDDCEFTVTHTLIMGDNDIDATINLEVIDESGNQVDCSFSITLKQSNTPINVNEDNDSINNEIDEQEEFITLEQIKIAPNPAQDVIRIYSGQFKVEYVEIYDEAGRLVKVKSFNDNNYDVDITYLETASYFVKIYVENQNIVRQLLKM